MASESGWEDILTITSKGQTGPEFPLHKPVMRIGRSSNNDIVLDDPLLSRHHARLDRQKDGWVIADLNSFNGTYVDGVRIRTPWPLRYGNRIKVGDTMMIFRRRKIEIGADAATLSEQRAAVAREIAKLQQELDELVPIAAEEVRDELDSIRRRFDKYDKLVASGATDQAGELLADVRASSSELGKRLPTLRRQSQQMQRMMVAHKVVGQLLAEVDGGLKELGRSGTDELRRARNKLRKRLQESQKAYEARDLRKAQVLISQEGAQEEIEKLQQALMELRRKKKEAKKPVKKRLRTLTDRLNIAREELITLAQQETVDSRQAKAEAAEGEPGKTDADKLRLRRLREELIQRLDRLRDPIDTLDIALKAARALPDFTLPQERQARVAVRAFQRAEAMLKRGRVEEAKASLDEVNEEQVNEWHEALRAKLKEIE